MSINMSAAKEPLFTEREVAEMLRISPSYVRVLRARKLIACFRFGDRALYSPSHIEAFKRMNEQRALSAQAA
jgi:DNA-binding transcriptional MerR regulator